MAMLVGAKGSQLVVKYRTSADGVTPKVFAGMCSINAEREFALEASVNESTGIDCADPEAPGWVERTVDSLSGQVTGSGRHAIADWPEWWAWFKSGQPKECQVVTNVDDGTTTTGFFLLTNLSKSGERGGFVESSITLQSTGELVDDSET